MTGIKAVSVGSMRVRNPAMDRREAAGPADLVVDAYGGVLVLTLNGEVDRSAARTLASCFERAVGSQRPVVADLTAVTALSEEALATLKAGYGRLGTRLHLVLERGDPAWKALRTAGASHLFIVHSSRPAALAAATPR
jgi:anti-anti-sigma regulatory factor